jgi:carboxyl-terminal processing protease
MGVCSILRVVLFLVLLTQLTFCQEVKAAVLTVEEQQVILEQSKVFAEILIAYARFSLNKPKDLRACAAEMLRMKPNEESCRDKYSAWLSREEKSDYDEALEGKFGGVGLEISEQSGKVVVISPIDDTPAARAGIKAGDIIYKIDGKSVSNIDDAVRRMRGDPGKAVEITVLRDGKEITFSIVRELITVSAVASKTLETSAGKIGYVRVKTFNEVMPGAFRDALHKFKNAGLKRVILDFRNNPGGMLSAALSILYDFARPADILITHRDRDGLTVFDTDYVRDQGYSRGIPAPGEFRDMTAVILVNGGSASASEIFAGAMKDWGFTVVGTRTFGKGVGQTIFTLSDGSALRLTTFEFLVGNSKVKIDGVGVIPNYIVQDVEQSSLGTLPDDKQLEKAIELLFSN